MQNNFAIYSKLYIWQSTDIFLYPPGIQMLNFIAIFFPCKSYRINLTKSRFRNILPINWSPLSCYLTHLTMFPVYKHNPTTIAALTENNTLIGRNIGESVTKLVCTKWIVALGTINIKQSLKNYSQTLIYRSK